MGTWEVGQGKNKRTRGFRNLVLGSKSGIARQSSLLTSILYAILMIWCLRPAPARWEEPSIKCTSVDRSGVVLGNFTDLQSTVNVQERAHHDHPVSLFCVEIVVMVGNRSRIFSCNKL